MKNREPFDWINEESLTFLRRGYLSEGEEPLDRIETIANHAEKLSRWLWARRQRDRWPGIASS